jgi:hypothetical protein
MAPPLSLPDAILRMLRASPVCAASSVLRPGLMIGYPVGGNAVLEAYFDRTVFGLSHRRLRDPLLI